MLVLILSFLGAPYLAVAGYIVLVSRSMSLTLRLQSSTGLSPVSAFSISLMLMVRLALAMSIWICSFVGTRMALGCGL